MRAQLLILIAAALLAASNVQARQVSPSYVWIEGETGQVTGVVPGEGGVGRPEFLSGRKWLAVGIEENRVDADVKGEGFLVRYPVQIPASRKYNLWIRLGFEFVRSPFEWRIGQEPWTRVTPETLTTDLMELSDWTEVAWLRLGERNLAAAKHTLEIRVLKSSDSAGKRQRLLFACDALCFYPGEFRPNGPYRPGQPYQTEQDRAAERTLFRLPAPAGPAARSSVELRGLWQVARADEQLPREVASPMLNPPGEAFWKSIPVPGDKNELRPDLLFAHRLWYRTRVEVPASAAGRSFHIVFPQNNLNTTVYVNGILCGFDKNPFARVEIDVTKAIRPGTRNEIIVGIRDAWYAYSTNPKDPMKLRRKFNLPARFFREGFQDLAFPIWNHPQSGILAAPTLVMAGATRTADAFCKPSAANKVLTVELTIANPRLAAASGTVQCEALDPRTGRVEWRAAKPFTLARGAAQTKLEISAPFPQARIWWPDDPQLTILRTTLLSGGKPLDVHQQEFGFREWRLEGKHITLNGIPWRAWADTHTADTPEAWLAFYRSTNQRMMRFWGTTWMGMPPEAALSFFDRNGVPVRRSGMLDGQAIGYMATEQDPDLKKQYGSEIKMQLMENWRDQLLAQIRGERHHPSIMVWSIENEWLYINCLNLHGGLMDEFEKVVADVADAARRLDPTRGVMVDGGGATKSQRLPIHGDHYVFEPNDTRYPDLAYEPNTTAGGRGRWEWDQKRPRFLGEDYFATGINPADYALLGGEETFLGKTYAYPAAGLIYRMLTEGYRWAEYAAWHFWMSQDQAVNQYGSNAWLAAFPKEWDWTFGSGQSVRRTIGIFNDTRFPEPVEFIWSLRVDSREIRGGTETVAVPAGGRSVREITLAMPTVTERTEGELRLALTRGGKEVYADARPLSILPPAVPQVEGLIVHDPGGQVSGYLRAAKVAFETAADLNNLPAAGRVLLVGKDALAERDSTSQALAAWAASGRAVVVLEQKHPLRYRALPAEIELSEGEGRVAFLEEPTHPVARGLGQRDLWSWGPGRWVYAQPYLKPSRGARSLVQCGRRLAQTALFEAPVGSGVLLVCQVRVAEHLAENAVARTLLSNMLTYAGRYRKEIRQTLVVSRDAHPQLLAALQAIGLRFGTAASPIEALRQADCRLIVAAGSPANLRELADSRDALDAFTARGGYLVLHGVGPEGLAEYNRLVGFDHMIRPFRRERVAFRAPKHPLLAGLTLGDVVMLSGERIFGWTADEFVADDIFTHVVDIDDIAPFAKFENDFVQMMTNGFVSADAWKYIVNLEAPNNPPLDFKLEFPKQVAINKVEWIGNTFYYPVTKVQLFFDGNAASAATLETRPNNDPQLFDLSAPLSGRVLTLRLAEWKKIPGKAQVTGLDNVRLFAANRPEIGTTIRPMLNIGAMVEYPRGQGGIVLCNLNLKESEAVPINKAKKRNILSTLLHNLHAPFQEAAGVIVGTPLQYTPVDISKHATQYRDERGWFGDRNRTLADLPTGRQTFAGVPFDVFTFATSPVPTAIMLGGPGVPNNPPEEVRGITVSRKADALFFLQTARMDQRRNDQERRERKQFIMARYVVHYADGATVEIPIRAEVDIDDYRQKQPGPLPGAQLGWSKRYPDSEEHAAVWVMQWDNPRPDVEIRSVDFVYGADRRGVPVLLALTAATAAR
jgi:beta-galactosidase